MFPHTERTDDFVHFVAYRFHSPVIEVVVMVVRDDKVIHLRDVFRRVNVRPLERLHHKKGREPRRQHRIDQYFLTAVNQQVRRVAEPYDGIFRQVQLFQVGLDRMDAFGRNKIVRFLFRQVVPHDPPPAFIGGHKRSRFLIYELPLFVVRRTFDPYQSFSTRSTAESRMVQNDNNGKNQYYKNGYTYNHFLFHPIMALSYE